MPFAFTEICTLLERLEENEHRHGVLVREQKANAKDIIERWFKSHRRLISELDVCGAAALLSSLLPERRTDRVYGAQSSRLSRTIARALALGNADLHVLEAYKVPGSGDLAACLGRVLSGFGGPAKPDVTVEEVDGLLQEWAALSTFSDSAIRLRHRISSSARDDIFGNILKRLDHRDAKWMIRIILKNLSPVRVDEETVLKSFHFLLPDLLCFQNNFHTAITVLKTQLRDFPEDPDPRSERLHRRLVDERFGLRPVTGTKIGPASFKKARSLDHCLTMLGHDTWVMERKYDGEYCEIHIDLRKSVSPAQCIKIFSKSGKDSTSDRAGIIPILVKSLRIRQEDCRFKEQAILLGELVVWSDMKKKVLPFSEIRKHVKRSGRRLGTKADSQPKASDHLAIAFFDLLLLDNEIVMNRSVEERRSYLREVYRKMHGKVIGVEWKQIDFADPRSRKRLVHQFALSNALGYEGLVLKPCGISYFSIETPNSSYIKLKKDYINGLGDECDFAVIGGSYSAQLAATTKMRDVKWTSFHLGCLTNKEDVCRTNATPIFLYVETIDCEYCIPRDVLHAANSLASFSCRPYRVNDRSPEFTIESYSPLKMDHTFFPPLVFEVLGSGFEKPSDCHFLMLRHPRVKKMHEDRSWKDCVSFQELQQLGADSRVVQSDPCQDRTVRWIERIERNFTAKIKRGDTVSPRSKGTSNTDQIVHRIVQPASSIKPFAGQGTSAPSIASPASSAQKLTNSLTVHPCTTQLQRETSKRPHNRSKEADVYQPLKKARSSAACTGLPTSSASSPLAEISNNIETTSAQNTARVSSRSNASSGRAGISVSGIQSDSRTDTEVDFATSITRCAQSRCPLMNAVVFVVPCIANTPYITENLLGLHEVVRTSELVHWDRDSLAHEPLGTTISESQAYAGMRKVVLVERKRHAAVRSIVQEVLKLNDGRFRERIDIYDWRMLEKCHEHDVGVEGFEEHFLGATLFDDTQNRALFVSNLDWLRTSRRR